MLFAHKRLHHAPVGHRAATGVRYCFVFPLHFIINQHFMLQSKDPTRLLIFLLEVIKICDWRVLMSSPTEMKWNICPQNKWFNSYEIIWIELLNGCCQKWKKSLRCSRIVKIKPACNVFNSTSLIEVQDQGSSLIQYGNLHNACIVFDELKRRFYSISL